MGNDSAVNIAKAALSKLDGTLVPKGRVKINLDELIRNNHPNNRVVKAFCTRDVARIVELQSMVFALAVAFKATLQRSKLGESANG